MFKRFLFPALAVVIVPDVVHADENCAANFLSGNARTVIDAQTGAPIVTLPYAAAGYAGTGSSYTVDLGGGAYRPPAYKPAPPPIKPPPPPPPPVEPGFMDDLALAPNDAGATRLVFPGDGTGRLTGPNTDFTFFGVDPTGLFVDRDLIARSGSGVINGEQTTALIRDGVALTLGSGFNVTRTRGVDASFANGVVLRTVVQISTPPAPPAGFSTDLTLQPNTLGAMRLVLPGDGTARLTGPGTDFTFTGVDASALAFDGPIVARGGSGTVNGQLTTAAPVIDDVANIVLTIGSGFNPTGTQAIRARFANGAELQAIVERR